MKITRISILVFLSLVFILIIFITHFLTVARLELISYDFRAYYTGGLMIGRGIVGNFYNISTQHYIQSPLSPEILRIDASLMPFIYPPFVAIPFFILTFFSFQIAYLIWGIINIFFLGAALFMLFDFLDKNIKYALLLKTGVMLFVLSFIPVWIALFQGQTSFIILIGFLGSYIYFRKNKSFKAGLLLGLIFFKPPLIILVVLIFLFKKQWKAIVGISLAGIIMTLASFLLVGVNGFLGYVKLITYVSSLGEGLTVHPRYEPTLRGFLQFFAKSDKLESVAIFYIGGVILSLFLLFWSFRGKWVTNSERFKFQWSILILTVIFTSLHLNYHELVLLLIPIIVFFNYLFIRYFKNTHLIYLSIGIYFLIILSLAFYLFVLKYPAIIVPFILLGMFLFTFISDKYYKNYPSQYQFTNIREAPKRSRKDKNKRIR